MDIFNILIKLFGGMGLFLYGIKIMGEGLENVTGEKLKSILEKVTSNKILGLLVGVLITAIIQSSSATTVMVVSFVNAGLMTLTQTVGVIMGANIGTTVTAQLVSFNLEKISPIFIGIGAIIMLVSKRKRTKDIAFIALGFGIIFLGMKMMSESMKPLVETNKIKGILMTIGDNQIFGLLVGLLITALVQSSSATTGVLVALATTGSINLDIALPIILGCNIGTCITALLASIGSNKIAKKAALIHLIFNVVGVIIFLPFAGFLIKIVEYIDPSDITRQVANAHTIFNIVTSLILLPLSKYLVILVNKILPGKDFMKHIGALYLDKKLLETPIVATGQVFKETIRMGEIAKKNVELAMMALLEDDEEAIKEVCSNEQIINSLEKEIVDYLVLLSSHELPEEDSRILSATFHVTNDIERIGDHAKNIIELTIEKQKHNAKIEGEVKEEAMSMYKKTIESVTIALDCYSKKDIIEAKKIKEIEESINEYEKALRENNILRLNKHKCSANVSAIFLDLISNLERIGDHSANIAERVL